MHQILQAIDGLHAALKDAADANPVFLSTAEKKAAIIELVRIESRLVELRLRVEADAKDVALHEGAKDVGAILVASGLDDAKHAHAEVRLAEALDRYEQVRSRLADGRFTTAHARAIVQALDALPEEIGRDIVGRAELHLCELGQQHSPRELRILGKHIVSVVAPEIGETAEARALLKEEADAAAKSTLSIKQLGDGTSRVYGIVADAVAARLNTVLESFAQPRKAALEADGRVRPRGRLMADALASLLERIDPDLLPAHGGDATTVVVTMSLASLRSDLGLATMADGTLITASEARRLACTAAIIPAVLGGNSEVLDLGRAKRLFSPAQRKALVIRDRHCRAEGCTVPSTWCDAHHIEPWSRGGKTDLDNAILLCGHHHRRIHDPNCELTRLPSGDFRFCLRQ